MYSISRPHYSKKTVEFESILSMVRLIQIQEVYMIRKTEAEKKEILDRLSHPDSGVSQLIEWRRRDGADPPPVIVDFVKRLRTISPELRRRARRRKPVQE